MAPLRCVRPSIRIVDVPAPSIGTPIACRNSHSSTTCGSVAAWRISVTPSAAAAASTRRLGAGDRRLVEIERGAAQPVGRVQLVARLGDDARPERDQRLHVRRDGAPRREVAARRRQAHAAGPGEQRAHQQHRPAQAADQLRIGRVARHRRRRDLERRRPESADPGAQAGEQVGHHADVRDARHVLETARLVAEQAGGDQRQRGVLVAVDGDAAGQSAAAFDEERGHGGVRGGAGPDQSNSPR